MIADDNGNIEALMIGRRSCRAFQNKSVSCEIVESILYLAQQTASWCNCQPWRVIVTKGEGTRRLKDTLVAYAQSGAEAHPDFPFPTEYTGVYQDRRREAGFQLYDAMGIKRGDREAYQQQTLENFSLFGAPHVAIITVDGALGVYGAIDCGAYVANFLLAAQSKGVATIAQASLAMYPDLIREQFDLPSDQKIVCGISFGYCDHDHPANSFRTKRADSTEETIWVSR